MTYRLMALVAFIVALLPFALPADVVYLKTAGDYMYLDLTDMVNKNEKLNSLVDEEALEKIMDRPDLSKLLLDNLAKLRKDDHFYLEVETIKMRKETRLTGAPEEWKPFFASMEYYFINLHDPRQVAMYTDLEFDKKKSHVVWATGSMEKWNEFEDNFRTDRTGVFPLRGGTLLKKYSITGMPARVTLMGGDVTVIEGALE